MCGIAGVLDLKGNNIDESVLKAMCSKMVHRGPDDEGYYSSNNAETSIGFGHRRLSIIDLKTGHQPVSNEGGNVWVMHNGEIYNFMELRDSLEKKGHVFSTRSDTEVIAHGYEEYGEDVFCHLRGMFAIAIWDDAKKKLVLARDRIGKKPLLYTQVNNKLIFASEFKAMLAHPDVGREIDFEAMHHYLSYLCIPQPLTAFKKIKKLPAAHIMVCQDGKIDIKSYWSLDFSKKLKISDTEAVERLTDILKEAVKVRLVSDVPLGVLLSGGIDSSCITAFMSQLQGDGIHSFSVGFGEAQFNELPYADLIAGHFKTDHHKDYVTPDTLEVLPELIERYGEPFADSSALPTYYVCKAASQNVKVALNGDGGDEAFGGYRRHLASYLATRYGPLAKMVNASPLKRFFDIFPDKPTSQHSPGNIRRFLSAAELNRAQRHMRWTGFFGENFKNKLYTYDFRRKTNGMDSGIFMVELFKQAEGLDSIDAALYVDTLFGLRNDLLVKMDIASMANSLETRSPMLDHKVMEFAASLPTNLKIRNFSLKYILKRMLKDTVPNKILNRPKRGFSIPADKWFRGPLKGYLIDTVLSKKAISRNYFRQNVLRQVIDDHVSAKDNYGQHLWGLLVLELWHRRFIDG